MKILNQEKGSAKFIIIFILIAGIIIGYFAYSNYSKKREKISISKTLQSQSQHDSARGSIQIEKDKLIFLDESGTEIKTIPLLETVPGESWSKVFVSKNGKYAAVNNVYKYNQKESIEDAEVVVLNWEGEEMWKAKHHFSSFMVSPNGKYLLAIPDEANGYAPISVFNAKGIAGSIKKIDQVWEADFSNNGSFFAVAVPVSSGSATGQYRYQFDLVVSDENGKELWRKENITSLESEFFPNVKIVDDVIVVIDNIDYDPHIIKEYRFDKQGNQL